MSSLNAEIGKKKKKKKKYDGVTKDCSREPMKGRTQPKHLCVEESSDKSTST